MRTIKPFITLAFRFFLVAIFLSLPACRTATRITMQAPSSAYRSVLRQLYKINTYNPVKMGLENTERLYSLIGRPLENLPIVHVAGTNGKGSVSLKTAECLRASGIKTGLFVSPHVSSFRERVQVNGVGLTEDDVVNMLPHIFSLCNKHNIPATFFEITTILAMMKFKEEACDAIVLEVGLGGRLDATNVIRPTLSVITSIQLDHMKILGNTIESIALEKAGIMKRGVDVLVGPGCPIELLRTRAKTVGSPFYTLTDVLKPDELLYKPPTLEGAADIDDLNTDIARAAIRLVRGKGGIFHKLDAKAEEALSVRPPCRFEIFQERVKRGGEESKNEKSRENVVASDVTVPVILDIAHNEDAIDALVKKIKVKYPNRPVRVVLGMSADKDVKRCVEILLTFLSDCDRIHCVAARHPRAMLSKDLRDEVHTVARSLSIPLPTSDSQSSSSCDGDIRSTLRQAIDLAATENAIVVTCGTAFIMAEARAELGVIEPKDGDILGDDAQEMFSNSK